MDKDDGIERYEDSSMICVFCFVLRKYSKNICILNARAPGTANGKVLQPATFGKTAKTKKKNTRSVEILGSTGSPRIFHALLRSLQFFFFYFFYFIRFRFALFSRTHSKKNK